MKSNDEWNIVMVNKYTIGDNGVSMETVVIPGFTSEELARSALESISALCNNPYDYSRGVVIKVKDGSKRCG
jgi:hypothetical protein